MSETVRYVLRVRERARTKRATKGSRKAAIELFCMECLGGCSAYEAIRCEVTECFLWPMGFGRGRATRETDDGDRV